MAEPLDDINITWVRYRSREDSDVAHGVVILGTEAQCRDLGIAIIRSPGLQFDDINIMPFTTLLSDDPHR